MDKNQNELLDPSIASYMKGLWESFGSGNKLVTPRERGALRAALWQSTRASFLGYLGDAGLTPDKERWPQRMQELIEYYLDRFQRLPVCEHGHTPVLARKFGGLSAVGANVAFGVLIEELKPWKAPAALGAGILSSQLLTVVRLRPQQWILVDARQGKLTELDQPTSTAIEQLGVYSLYLEPATRQQLNTRCRLLVTLPWGDGALYSLITVVNPIAVVGFADRSSPSRDLTLGPPTPPLEDLNRHNWLMAQLFPEYEAVLRHPAWNVETGRLMALKNCEGLMRMLKDPDSRQPLFDPVLSPQVLDALERESGAINATILQGNPPPPHLPPELATYLDKFGRALQAAGPSAWAYLSETGRQDLYDRSFREAADPRLPSTPPQEPGS